MGYGAIANNISAIHSRAQGGDLMTELGRTEQMNPSLPQDPPAGEFSDATIQLDVPTHPLTPERGQPRTALAASRRDRTRAIDCVLVGLVVTAGAWLVGANVALAGVVAVVLTLMVGGTSRLHSDMMTRGDVWRRTTATTVAVALGIVLVDPTPWSTERLTLIASVVVATAALVAAHEFGGQIDTPLFGTASRAARTLLIGDETALAEFEALTADSASLLVEERLTVDTSVDDVRRPMQAADKAVALAESLKIERVVLVAAAPGHPAVKSIVRRLTLRGIGVEIVTGATSISPNRLSPGHLGDFATLRVRGGLTGRRRLWVKRAFDIVVSSLMIATLSPVLALVAIAVKLDSKGPVLYQQRRLGRNGGQFSMLKFRSMVQDAEQQLIDLTEENGADGPLFKMKDDPRVTRVGRVIRRLSLDELPQLWNVVRGEMSLVGPRPALPSEADGWTPELFDRLEVSPGVTGPWQVSGRSDASFADYWRLDLYYIDNWSLGLDINILLRTVPAIIRGTGAY